MGSFQFLQDEGVAPRVMCLHLAMAWVRERPAAGNTLRHGLSCKALPSKRGMCADPPYLARHAAQRMPA